MAIGCAFVQGAVIRDLVSQPIDCRVRKYEFHWAKCVLQPVIVKYFELPDRSVSGTTMGLNVHLTAQNACIASMSAHVQRKLAISGGPFRVLYDLQTTD